MANPGLRTRENAYKVGFFFSKTSDEGWLWTGLNLPISYRSFIGYGSPMFLLLRCEWNFAYPYIYFGLYKALRSWENAHKDFFFFLKNSDSDFYLSIQLSTLVGPFILQSSFPIWLPISTVGYVYNQNVLACITSGCCRNWRVND